MYIRTWKKPRRANVHGADHLQARTNVSSVCLPFQIQSAVPQCAFSCIQDFVLQNYGTSDCLLTSDINFLCTTPTKSGLTIGDGNLQCVISCCPTANLATESGYNVCSSVAGALPNTAGTITATMSDVPTSSPTYASSTQASGTDVIPSASQSVASVTLRTVYSIVSTTTTFVTLAASSSLSMGSIQSSPTSSSIQSAASSSSFIPEPEPTSFPTTSSIPTQASTSIFTPSSSSNVSSATSASDSTGMVKPSVVQQPTLSTAGIAAIAIGSTLIGALAIAFLVYLCCARKRRRRGRDQHTLSEFSPDAEHHKIVDYDSPVDRPFPSAAEVPASRYRPGEAKQTRDDSLSQNAMVPDHNIGAVLPPRPTQHLRHGGPALRWQLFPVSNNTVPGLVSSHAQVQAPVISHDSEENRWSDATSFDENVEGEDQELPALAHPGRARSSRSHSSNTIEMPAPLKIDTSKANNSDARKVQLTPTYDNGYYEPIPIPAAITPIRSMRPARSSSKQAPNFSRPEPLTARSQPQVSLQNAVPAVTVRGSARPVALHSSRKSSTQTNQTLSVHTEIEEDTTPELEDDKQLRLAQRPPYKTPKTPLRDLRYPQIPRSATIRSQAETPHSPRAVHVPRFVDITPTRLPPTKPRTRDKLVQQRQSFFRTNTSSMSDTEIKSQSSTSPIFPTPPNRAHTQVPSTTLTRSISNAVQKAAAPKTTVFSSYADPFTGAAGTQHVATLANTFVNIFPPPRKSSLAHARSHATRPRLVRRDQDQNTPLYQRSHPHIADALYTQQNSHTMHDYPRHVNEQRRG